MRCHVLLADAFALAKRTDGMWRQARYPTGPPHYVQRSAAAGIEPDYVRRDPPFRVTADIAEDEAWPWPVKIYTLALRGLRGSQLLEFRTRRPRSCGAQGVARVRRAVPARRLPMRSGGHEATPAGVR